MTNDETICFCFGYRASEIAADAKKHGRSTIMERIAAAKKSGGCRCAETNPKGR